jgi:hypothetical protein
MSTAEYPVENDVVDFDGGNNISFLVFVVQAFSMNALLPVFFQGLFVVVVGIFIRRHVRWFPVIQVANFLIHQKLVGVGIVNDIGFDIRRIMQFEPFVVVEKHRVFSTLVCVGVHQFYIRGVEFGLGSKKKISVRGYRPYAGSCHKNNRQHGEGKDSQKSIFKCLVQTKNL